MDESPKRVREGMVVRKFRLGEEPEHDVLLSLPPDERLSLVWELTRRIWLFQGSPPCPYARDSIPIRVIGRDE